jgi:hypothetical protein
MENQKMDIKEVKKAWARSVNNKDYHPYKDKQYGNKVPGKLKSVHHVVYNILRELPKERGFEPLGEGYKTAEWWLQYLSRYDHYDDLLFPFERTVTAQEFKELL